MLRRVRIAAACLLVLFALYVVLGFLLAPTIVRSWVLPKVQEKLVPTLAIERLKINPLTLSVTARGLTLTPAEGSDLVAIGEIYVNLSARSLLRLHPVVTELRLTAPSVQLVRDAAGELNWNTLLVSSDEPPPPEDAGDAATPHFVLENLAILEGVIHFHDAVPGEAFEQTLGPATFHLVGLDTTLEESGRLSLAATTPEGAELSWEGSLHLFPLASEGRIQFSGIAAHRASPYLASELGLATSSVSVSWELGYTVRLDPHAPILRVHDAALELNDLSLHRSAVDEPFLALESLKITGADADLVEHTALVNAVEVAAPHLRVARDAEGAIDLLALIPPAPEGGEPTADTPSTPWQWSLGTISVTGGRLDWSDAAVSPGVEIPVLLPQFTAGPLQSDLSQAVPLELALDLPSGSHFTLAGSVAAAPLAADLEGSLAGFDPGAFGAYWSPASGLTWTRGTLSTDFHLALASGTDGTPAVTARAGVAIEEPRVIETASGEPLLEGGSIRAEGIDFDSAGATLEVSRLLVEGLVGRLHRNAEGQLNLPGAPPSEAPATDQPEAAAPTTADRIHLRVPLVELRDNAVALFDESVSPAAELRLEGFAGSIRGIDSDPEARAELDLAGRVQGVSPLTLRGTVNPFPEQLFVDLSTDLGSTDMTLVSPYAGRYLGRRIAKGKLSFEVINHIEDRQLKGSNTVRIDQLEFGESVDSPDAKRLPLDLALTLFKDSSGVIEIDLPVAGDLDDPSFSYAGIVFQVFGNLLTKAITSPFRFLAGQFAPSGVDPSTLAFLPGTAELDAPDPVIEALVAMHQARPLVVFELQGQYAPADLEALQKTTLERHLRERWEAIAPNLREPFADSRETLLRALDEARVSAAPIPPPDNAAAAAVPLSVVEARVRASLVIPASEFQALARRRGETAQAALLAAGLPAESIFLLEPATGQTELPAATVEIEH